MSEFRERLRSIRAQAEERASRLGASQDARLASASEEQQRFAQFTGQVGELLEELAHNFSDEFEGFEHIRVAMDGGQCVRISRLEDIEENRKLSRLTFNIETIEDGAAEGETTLVLRISCKVIVFNRERGQDEIEVALAGARATASEGPAAAPRAPEEAPAGAVTGTPYAQAVGDETAGLDRVREFAERNVLEFASAYEDARMSSLRPIP